MTKFNSPYTIELWNKQFERFFSEGVLDRIAKENAPPLDPFWQENKFPEYRYVDSISEHCCYDCMQQFIDSVPLIGC